MRSSTAVSLAFVSLAPRSLALVGLALGAACLAACSSKSSSRATRAFVRPGGTGTADGSSWENASGDLQAAIDAARVGDEVWVAEGTYSPAPPGGPRTASFRLKRGVAVRGGFSGTETSLAERAAASYLSILSGDLAGDDGPGFSGMAENCYHVVKAVGDAGSGTLDGFVVRGGRADGPGKGASIESDDQGSGLDVFDSSPRVLGCTFEGNWSANHGAVNDHGVASTYEGCTFRGNRSDMLGAGLYIHHHARTVAVECIFEDNETLGNGGGAYARSDDAPLFQDCIFRRNRAELGAGVYVAQQGTAQISNSVFEDNVAVNGGGGVYSDDASPAVRTSLFRRNQAGVGVTAGAGGGGGSGGAGVWGNGGTPLVEDCQFEHNDASFGAGVYMIEFCTGTVRRCTFVENTANEAGGLYTLNSDVLAEDCLFRQNRATTGSFSVGGGMSNYFSNAVARRCTFIGNTAQVGGGGMYCEGEFPRILECRFVGNRALEGVEGYGGAVLFSFFCHGEIVSSLLVGNEAKHGGALAYLTNADARVVNCTLVENRATEGDGSIAALFASGPRVANSILWSNVPATLTLAKFELQYSCIEGGAVGIGIQSGDPGLASLPSAGLDGVYGTSDDVVGDLALAPGSPCIDAGNNSQLAVDAVLDLVGHVRRSDDPSVPDTGIPRAPVVDLGSVEHGSSPPRPR